MRLSLLFPALLFAGLGISVEAQEREPFSIEHLVRLQRVSQPALSPDGRTVAFTVRDTDMAANRGRQDIWTLDLETKGARPVRLTTHPDSDHSAQWSSDGEYLYFLSTRSGSSQVWRIPNRRGEAEQVTDLPLDVGSFRLSPEGTRIALTLEVFPDCDTLRCTSDRLEQATQSPETGMTFDRIFGNGFEQFEGS